MVICLGFLKVLSIDSGPDVSKTLCFTAFGDHLGFAIGITLHSFLGCRRSTAISKVRVLHGRSEQDLEKYPFHVDETRAGDVMPRIH